MSKFIFLDSFAFGLRRPYTSVKMKAQTRILRCNKWLGPTRLTALLYLALIIAAEIITNFVDGSGGITLFIFILFGLLLHFSVASDRLLRRLLLSLCLIPMVRIIGASISSEGYSQIYWYPIIYTPLLITTFIIIRYMGILPSEVALTIKRQQIRSQILIGLSGVALALVEYLILKPYPLIKELNPVSVILPALILIVFVGLTEELIFRGLLQMASIGLLGTGAGILYVSVLFAILHVGYVQGVWNLTALDVPAVFIIALFFSWIVKRTGTLLGVILSHSLTNIGLFLILPFLFQ